MPGVCSSIARMSRIVQASASAFLILYIFWSTFFGRTSQNDIVERERSGPTEDKGEKPCEIEKISLISRLTKMRACSIYGQQFD
jgi:hypothetical protein